ncbi:hypothetical protein [Lentibacillus sp. Marseille-P4043]|uniref:hypothetical protein n=1 Tax=Lentibacillus sp. Marseille-P4043 TaxID=2040293 RepID=UPI000D0B3166|nr:hypothetical protein [Lentibacillus sp. Marseille-P4043]
MEKLDINSIIRNKKALFSLSAFVIIVIAVILIYILSSASTTTAVITVLEKGYSKDTQEAFIITAPPNSSDEIYEIKILVKEPMVWNLIEKGKVYTIDYDSRQNDRILKQIHIFGDDKAIE